MSEWTSSNVPDQTGRTVVVTGANSGIGFHAARVLAERGADVVLGVRDTGRGEDAAGRIRSGACDARVEVRRLDLADLGSVREFASALRERFGDGLDLLSDLQQPFDGRDDRQAALGGLRGAHERSLRVRGGCRGGVGAFARTSDS